MKATLNDWTDEDEISRYLTALLHKEAFDRAGLIYGMGHAVYSLSDPRAQIFRGFVEKLSAEKGCEKEFALYAAVERLAPKIIARERKIYKGVSPNVDFFKRLCIQHAGTSRRTLHADLCNRPYRRMERTPSGGSDRRRKNHASCLQKCQRAQTLCANVRAQLKSLTRACLPSQTKMCFAPCVFINCKRSTTCSTSHDCASIIPLHASAHPDTKRVLCGCRNSQPQRTLHPVTKISYALCAVHFETTRKLQEIQASQPR